MCSNNNKPPPGMIPMNRTLIVTRNTRLNIALLALSSTRAWLLGFKSNDEQAGRWVPLLLGVLGRVIFDGELILLSCHGTQHQALRYEYYVNNLDVGHQRLINSVMLIKSRRNLVYSNLWSFSVCLLCVFVLSTGMCRNMEFFHLKLEMVFEDRWRLKDEK